MSVFPSFGLESMFRRRTREPPPLVTARACAFPQLLAARQRHLTSSEQLAAAGDPRTAMDAFLRADAIGGELAGMSGR